MKSGVLCILCAAGSLGGQSVPDPWGDITGRVRDQDGAPIAGASVRLDARTRPQHQFEVVAEALARGRPLPAVRSTRDGSFVLPVLLELRETSMLGLAWTLVVEKDGYEVWHEHLPNGLHGYLGSEVVLRPAATDDEVEFFAEGAPAGSCVVLRSDSATHVVVLDGDGRARVRLPRVPCPLQPHGGLVRNLRWLVTPCEPGWAAALLQRPVHRLTRTEAAAATTVVRLDDRPVSGARALVSCGAQFAWLNLPAARWVGHSPPLAFLADGCRMAREPRLQALPPSPPRRLRIVDPDGQPIAHARAVLLRAEQWWPRRERKDTAIVAPGLAMGVRTPWRRPRPVASDGGLDLGVDLPADDPVVLRVVAEGFAITDVLDPRGLDAGAAVTLARRDCGTLEVCVTDEQGAAIAGAAVWLSDTADAPVSWLGEKLETGGNGMVTARGLLPGGCTVFVAKRGCLGRFAASHQKAGTTIRVTCVLPEGEARAFVVRDAEGDPIPFAELQCTHDGKRPRAGLLGTGNAQDPHRLHADACGRLLLPVTQRPSFSDGQGGAPYVASGPPTDWGEIVAERPQAVWVVPGEGMALADVFVERASRTLGGRDGSGEGALAFVLPGSECRATLTPAGIARLAFAEVARLPRDPATGLPRWVVGTARVAVEFVSPCAQPELLWGVSGDGPTLRFAKETAVVFLDARGVWRCSDPAVRRLVFLHPKYAPLVVEMTEAQRTGTEPLRLALQPGSALLVDAVRGGPGSHRMKIAVRGAPLPGWVIEYEPDVVFAKGFPPNMQPQSPLSLPALAAGTWEVAVDAALYGYSGAPGRTLSWTKTIQVDGVRAIEVAEDAK